MIETYNIILLPISDSSGSEVAGLFQFQVSRNLIFFQKTTSKSM